MYVCIERERERDRDITILYHIKYCNVLQHAFVGPLRFRNMRFNIVQCNIIMLIYI